MEKIILPATVDCLGQGLDHVAACAALEGFGPEQIEKIKLAVEEALVNICSHAYPLGGGWIEVRCAGVEGRQFIIELVDNGEQFDPCHLPDPDLPPELERRSLGGLGILLTRSLVDQVSHCREGNQNILRLTIGRV